MYAAAGVEVFAPAFHPPSGSVMATEMEVDQPSPSVGGSTGAISVPVGVARNLRILDSQKEILFFNSAISSKT